MKYERNPLITRSKSTYPNRQIRARSSRLDQSRCRDAKAYTCGKLPSPPKPNRPFERSRACAPHPRARGQAKAVPSTKGRVQECESLGPEACPSSANRVFNGAFLQRRSGRVRGRRAGIHVYFLKALSHGPDSCCTTKRNFKSRTIRKKRFAYFSGACQIPKKSKRSMPRPTDARCSSSTGGPAASSRATTKWTRKRPPKLTWPPSGTVHCYAATPSAPSVHAAALQEGFDQVPRWSYVYPFGAMPPRRKCARSERVALRDWDHKAFEEQMFHFNTVTRVQYYQHSIRGV